MITRDQWDAMTPDEQWAYVQTARKQIVYLESAVSQQAMDAARFLSTCEATITFSYVEDSIEHATTRKL